MHQELKPAKKRTLRRVNGPLHKCRCRRIIGVWRTQITTCLCGERYQWADPGRRKIAEEQTPLVEYKDVG